MKRTRQQRRPTLQDVADLAGVNRVTVSVAMGRSPRSGTRISEPTRRRILEAARTLGYAPNAIAQALRSQRTNVIGYYAGYEALSALGPFSAAVLTGLQHSCRQYQQDLILFGSFRRDSVDDIYNTLAGGKIDGIVLLPTPLSPVMDRLVDSHLPVVAITNSLPSVPSVVVDDVAGARLQAQYLKKQGHRRVLYRANQHDHVSTVHRQQAFLAAAQELALTVTVVCSATDGQLLEEELELLRSPSRRPSAAVCWADSNAYQLLDSCTYHQIKVPEDLAVIGFDGVPLEVRPARQLTTISANWDKVAYTAVEHLLALLNGDDVPQQTVLPVEFRAGDTA